jgi:hypothetical protein
LSFFAGVFVSEWALMPKVEIDDLARACGVLIGKLPPWQ